MLYGQLRDHQRGRTTGWGHPSEYRAQFAARLPQFMSSRSSAHEPVMSDARHSSTPTKKGSSMEIRISKSQWAMLEAIAEGYEKRDHGVPTSEVLLGMALALMYRAEQNQGGVLENLERFPQPIGPFRSPSNIGSCVGSGNVASGVSRSLPPADFSTALDRGKSSGLVGNLSPDALTKSKDCSLFQCAARGRPNCSIGSLDTCRCFVR